MRETLDPRDRNSQAVGCSLGGGCRYHLSVKLDAFPPPSLRPVVYMMLHRTRIPSSASLSNCSTVVRQWSLTAGPVLLLLLANGLSPSPSAGAAEPTKETFAADTFSRQITPLLVRYCIDCHGPDSQEAGIAFNKYTSVHSVREDRDAWMKVDEMVLFGAMPPEDQPQPTQEQRKLISRWIQSLFATDCSKQRDPGRETIRRLNRAEYDNTIRDLTGLDLHLADDFPSDDVGEGFDNIGDVLSLPPLLFEKYMDAAERVATAAIVAEPVGAQTQQKSGKELRGTGSANLGGGDIYRLASAGSVSVEFEFPRDGQYVLRVEAGAQQAGSEVAKAQLSLDGEPGEVVEVPASASQLETYEIQAAIAKGKHRLSASFINDYYNPEARNPKDRDRNMVIRSLAVFGPVDWRDEELPESHRRIVIARPNDEKSPQAAARQVLERFATRAFRRPVKPEELSGLVQLVELALAEGDSFERGIQVAVSAVLVSPQFLIRMELDPAPDDPQQIRVLNDFELATRLSYFLWSSMPDDELFTLAAEGKLGHDDVLAQQVSRMLQDPKAEALVRNFGGQWLNLRNLEEVTPDPKAYATFDDSLRQAMRRETELFFAAVMREDRSIIEFLEGDFSFVNARLADHYGIAGVRGDQFQRVSLSGGHRKGLLTQASILTLTSNPNRTSPVKRGKWIMENILGTPPPEPPANVPMLEETQEAAPDATLREQMVMHRENPVCASCHLQMDELGFGFENFDPIGRWRERDGNKPIDAAGELPSGQRFTKPTELVAILASMKRDFSEAFARKMLTYALGRGLKPFDDCAVQDLVHRLERNDYRFSSLVHGIVVSDPFRKRRGEEKGG